MECNNVKGNDIESNNIDYNIYIQCFIYIECNDIECNNI